MRRPKRREPAGMVRLTCRGNSVMPGAPAVRVCQAMVDDDGFGRRTCATADTDSCPRRSPRRKADRRSQGPLLQHCRLRHYAPGGAAWPFPKRKRKLKQRSACNPVIRLRNFRPTVLRSPRESAVPATNSMSEQEPGCTKVKQKISSAFRKVSEVEDSAIP